MKRKLIIHLDLDATPKVSCYTEANIPELKKKKEKEKDS